MAIDYSVGGGAGAVAAGQWTRETGALAAIGDALPARLLDSRPLAEVHRLDLALFVVFEDASLRVSGALTRRAPTLDALNFASQQTLDEAHHHEVFLRRSDQARAAAGLPPGEIDPAILIPPLRRFIDRCYEVADAGDFVEGLALT